MALGRGLGELLGEVESAYENSTGNLDLTITYTVYMVEK